MLNITYTNRELKNPQLVVELVNGKLMTKELTVIGENFLGLPQRQVVSTRKDFAKIMTDLHTLVTSLGTDNIKCIHLPHLVSEQLTHALIRGYFIGTFPDANFDVEVHAGEQYTDALNNFKEILNRKPIPCS